MIGFQIALEKVGDQGIYQLHVFSIFILMMITMSLAIMFPTYAYITPKLYCNGEICEQNLQTCSNEFTVDPNFQYSNYVTEFSLFCDNKRYIAIATSITFFGAIIGGILNSHIADNYGRKTALFLAQLFTILGTFTIYNSTTIYQLIFGNFILGVGEYGKIVVLYVFINEICGTNLRQVFTMGLLLFWSFAEILLAYLFNIIFDWHTILLYFIIIPDIILFFLSFTIAESPKYYYGQQQYEKAIDALNFIAKYNQKPYLPQKCLIPIEQSKVHYHIFDLFRHPSLRYPSIGFMTISFCLHLIYYGAQFEIAFLIDSKFIYKIGAMLGLFELLTYLMMAQLIQQVRRKVASTISFLICAIICILLFSYGLRKFQVSCVDCYQEYLCLFLLSLLRTFNTVGFGLQTLFSNEFYPTPLRTLGSGFVFSVGATGSFLAPYLQGFAVYFAITPFIIFFTVSIIGALSVTLTKETWGKYLKDTVNSIE